MTNYSADNPIFSNAVLVYGPRKGGTTLLQSLLDGGQALQMVPGELKLKALFKQEKHGLKQLVDFFIGQQGRSFFSRLIEEGPEGLRVKDEFFIQNKPNPADGDIAEERVDEPSTPEDLVDWDVYVRRLEELSNLSSGSSADVLRHDAAAFFSALKNEPTSCRFWASKEVGGKTDRIIRFFHSMFPEGKVVFLVRDPLFVSRSIILERRRRGIELSAGDIVRQYVDSQNVVNYVAQFARENDIIVAYELLTQDTEKEMTRVARGLGIPYEPVMEVPTILGMSTVVHTSSKSTTKVFQQPRSWKRDLYFSQIMVLHGLRLFAPLLYSIFRLRYARYPWIRYSKLFERIKKMSDSFVL